MTAPTARPPESAPLEPTAPRGPQYRSLADGELATAWSLKDFFSNVNTVLRLPARPKPSAAQAAADAKAKGGLKLPTLEQLHIPRWALVVGALLTIGYVGVRPLVVSFLAGSTLPLDPAYGVWQAEGGKYTGRMFELTEHTIAFRTSRDSPDYTWHKVTGHRSRTLGDSTLFTVEYEESGRTAEFGFWLLQQQRKPLIHVQRQAGVAWTKTPFEPQRPR